MIIRGATGFESRDQLSDASAMSSRFQLNFVLDLLQLIEVARTYSCANKVTD